MKLLAFDPSKSCGVAFFDGHEISYDLIVLKAAENGQCYCDFKARLEFIMDEYKPDSVIFESFFSRGKFCQGIDVNFVLRGLIEMVCTEHGIPYVSASPSEWKKYISGRSMPTKEDKALYKTKANKIFIQNALKEKFNISLPEKLEKKQMPSDIYDAIGILIYGLYLKTQSKPNPTLRNK